MDLEVGVELEQPERQPRQRVGGAGDPAAVFAERARSRGPPPPSGARRARRAPRSSPPSRRSAPGRASGARRTRRGRGRRAARAADRVSGSSTDPRSGRRGTSASRRDRRPTRRGTSGGRPRRARSARRPFATPPRPRRGSGSAAARPDPMARAIVVRMCRIDARLAPVERPGGGGHPREPASKARRHDLLELRQCADRRLVDPGHGVRRDRSQADRDRDGLLVVEQERRHLRPCREPVAALHADRALHRVAEVAQPVDVAADGPPADLEPLGELAARPGARRLEQRQEGQESRRRTHGSKYAANEDRF